MEDLLKIETASGRLAGTREAGVRSWKGVPYAAPPTGNLRFRHALPSRPWAGTRDASRFGPSCPQEVRKNGPEIDEDSLTLNIWAPDSEEKSKPVLVFVHGGSFCKGSGSSPDINGADLAAGIDAVVVTLNYRLGALGFLDFSFLDTDFQANCGVSDVVQALRWLHENVEAFGGAPGNMTLFGQSAGAILASMLPVMPGAAGLVQRGILMSAGPTLPFTRDGSLELSNQFAQFMGIGKDALMTMPAADLTARQQEFRRACGLGAGTFMPQIDGDLIEDYPIAAAAAGRARPVPLLIGTCREEMSFLYVKPVAEALEISGIMNAGVDAELPEVRERIARGYDRYGRRGPAILVSDLVFRMGSVWLAETMSAFSDVWMYRFDYETPAMKVSNLHAFHSSDVPFVFGNYASGMAPLMFLFSLSRRQIRAVTREMREDFAAFARGETLPWARCRGTDTPAKCYRKRPVVEQAVDLDVKHNYIGSRFRARSFAGQNNNLHGAS